MPDFLFEGRIPSSKSLMNRALIIRSHATPRFFLSGESDAEDVVFLRKALGKIEDGKEYYLGDGGTTLRFFALRAARERGTFTLKVSERLFRRPQKALQEVLGLLGVQMEAGDNLFTITSKGWKDPQGPLKVPVGDSSQFASAVVLNAWELPYDLEISLDGQRASESYLKMTLELCRYAGMTILETPTGLKIPREQKVQMKSYSVESDLSSVFSIASLAALGGQATFLELPEKSLQPDQRFVDLFRQMGVPVEHRDQRLVVRKAASLKAIEVDLGESPDLVPVLSVVCAFAKGRSILKGAPQLRHKESDRIQSSALLLKKMGINVTEREDGLEIEGQPDLLPREFIFDPDKDHRLAMAAGILIRLGWPLHLTEPEVVHKSFPEFWHILKTGPHLVVGHRGTGKTSLIERLSSSSNDLDAEIEKKSGQDVFTFFRDHGEEGFRQKEISVLKEVIAQAGPQTWIALGAGFRLEDEGFEKHGEILWARRDTDREGRVFLDRPRLDPTADPLVEFRLRARGRENLYSRYADRVYTIPEGLHRPDAIENKILLGSLSDTGGVVTMFPIHRRGIPQLGADYYELRDDLLDPDEIHSLFHKLPPEKILYSVRRHKHIPEFVRKSGCWIDWALDFAYPDKDLVEHLASRLILSSHGTLKESLLDFRLYSKFNVHWKLSPPTESYEDLQEGHLWWNQSPETRSFLPRSAEGRFAWYRLWMKGRSKFNFWREGVGSSLDQPTLWQWLATPARAESFAAVLGAPVYHSWTPTEHHQFFADRKMPVWSIDVREGEWGKALPFLQELGLRYAAVTAPLKGRAFRTGEPSDLAKSLGSANTLFWNNNKNCWQGHNTDLEGLIEALKPWKMNSVAIWGGGGTLPVLGKVLPEASAFSSTGGHLRQGSKPLSALPDVVIWAAPRGTELKWPSSDSKPGLVIDLNYKEDSPGREYALRCKARYVSGETMFRAQAEGQRQFWKEQEK